MKTKIILTALVALLFNTLMGGFLASCLGVNPLFGAIGLNAIGFAVSFSPTLSSALREGVYREFWTSEVIKHYSRAEEKAFLDGLPDYSSKVDTKETLHLSDIPGKPTVLIDNEDYPLQVETLPNGDVALKLHKFETLPTSITDEELYALSFDKIKEVKTLHGDSLAESRLDFAAYLLAPVENTADTPVILTSGVTPTDGRLPMRREDVLEAKKRCDKMGMPKQGRRLVLSNDHINDLLAQDQKFRDQYYNYETGKVSKIYGFEVYEFSNCPLFGQNLKKKPFGAVAGDGDFEASFFFYTKQMFKATGSTKMYYSPSGTDPINKRNLVDFTNFFVALPKKYAKSVGAIVSKKYVSA